MKPNQSLRAERELRGWSQARVAREIGTTAHNVSRWERGQTSPYPYFREQLCILYGKNARELGLVEDTEFIEKPETQLHQVLITSNAQEGHRNILSQTESITDVFDPMTPLPIDHDLVGREEVLHRVEQLITGEARQRTVALTGLPGIGKTALAITLVYDRYVREQFPDGVFWAGLGSKPRIAEHLSRWAMLLGLSGVDIAVLHSQEEWSKAIRTQIGARRMLLVIDDVWDIEDALAFKVGGRNCTHLITTRSPTVARAFAPNGTYVVQELSERDSFTLFMHLAPGAQEYEQETVQELVNAVGGLPLALTLMGKCLNIQMHSGQPRRIQAALQRLRDSEERLRLSKAQSPLDRPPALLPGVPISLQTVIGVSDQLLNEQARMMLRSLSVFPAKPNSFSEEAALAVSNYSVEVLDLLTDAGLLEGSGPGRYMLHRSIADYARASLQDGSAYKRFVEFMVRYVQVHRQDDDALTLESKNILTALDVAFERSMWNDLQQGTEIFAAFLIRRGMLRLAEQLLMRVHQAIM